MLLSCTWTKTWALKKRFRNQRTQKFSFPQNIGCRGSAQGRTVNVSSVSLFYSSGSLKPSSCCLRQSQTVDLTLNGVREHMKRREKEHDRWTIECTAGLWKEVWEEATRGHPKIHTPSTVLVQAIERLRFQGRGQGTSRPYVESVPVCVCMHRSVSTFMRLVQKWQIKVRWRFVPTCSH